MIGFDPNPSPNPLPEGEGVQEKSHHGPIRNQSVLRHDNNPVANVVTAVWTVRLFYSGLIQQTNSGADARILVDDRAADDRAFADADPRLAGRQIGFHIFQGLIVIGSHYV